MKTPKTKKIKQICLSILAFAIGLGGGIGLGVAIAAYMDRIADRISMPLWLAVVALGFVLFTYAQIAVHEGGHLVGGLLSGYRFSSYRIGSWMWQREGERIVLRRLSIAGTGGQCLMAPPPMVDGRIPYRLYNFGGVLANLVLTALLTALWALFRANPYLGPLCLIGATVGLVFALTNGIPLHTAQIDNDGYNALSLGRRPDALRAFWLQMQINAELAAGRRLHEMPDDWFVATDLDLQNAMTAAVAVFACNRLVDAGQLTEADARMAALIDGDNAVVGIHRALMTCDRITIAYLGGETARALSLLTPAQRKFMRSMKDFPSVLRTAYAEALLGEQDRERGADLRTRFEKVAARYPYPADIATERELIVQIDEAADAH